MDSLSEVKTPRAVASPKRKSLLLIRCILPSKTLKIMMILNNRNVPISITEINTESITTLLNKLPHLSDSRHLKNRYVHVIIEQPKIDYGS